MSRYTFPRLPAEPAADNHAAIRRVLDGKRLRMHALKVNGPVAPREGKAPATNLILVVGDRTDRLGEPVVVFYRWKRGRFTSSTQGVAARHLLDVSTDHPDLASMLEAVG